MQALMQASQASPHESFTPADALGQRFAMAGVEARIASLVPSLTETLFDLGLGAQVVARTGFCIYPADVVRAVPKVGGTKDVNLARLRALAPSHVLVNVDENTRDTVAALRAFVPNVVVTHPQAPRDNLALLALLGGLFGAAPGVQARAQELARALRLQCDALAATSWPARRVLYLIWRDPWMTVARDTYIASTLACVGWQTLPAVMGGDGLATPGAARYPSFNWDAPWLRDVDLVLLSTEPYRFQRADADAVRGLLAARGLHPEMRLIDGEWCSWYGSRALRSLPLLAAFAQGPECTG